MAIDPRLNAPSPDCARSPQSGPSDRRIDDIVEPAIDPPRFVGYMSPEAVLRSHVRAQKGKDVSLDENDCGHWMRPAHEGRDAVENGVVSQRGPSSRTADLPPPKRAAVERALQTYLDTIGIMDMPPRQHQDILMDIYFNYVQPVLPILDQSDFTIKYREGVEKQVLVQAICIVASKHDRARDHLYLGDDPTLLKPREFAKRLYPSVIAAIEAKLETDRIVLIQVLTLLSLHCEGFDGAEEASMHLTQAIHHAHTFGLQFGRPRFHAAGRADSLENLFWCLWTLDRLNASINARPSIIHDRDNSIERLTSKPEKRRTAFGMWVQLAEALDKVIVFYRPGTKDEETGWEIGFPSFEDIIGEGGDSLDPPILGRHHLFQAELSRPVTHHRLAVLELFYHAVAMASHKSHSINDPVRATASYVRQSLSAVRVISILSTESPDDLPPLPIVPYAASLAMSVAYRHFRQSKLQTHKNRGKEDLKTCCTLLDRLRTSWWSAGAMADLGKAALNKAERNSERNSDGSKGDTLKSGSASRAERQVSFQREGGRSSIASPLSAPAVGTSTSPPAVNQQKSPTFITGFDPADSAVAGMSTASSGGHHPSVSSERADASSLSSFNLTESPDWLNFDNAFENIDTLLGSSGADLSNELLKPFNYQGLDFWGPP
jgi:hypothetical protein